VSTPHTQLPSCLAFSSQLLTSLCNGFRFGCQDALHQPLRGKYQVTTVRRTAVHPSLAMEMVLICVCSSQNTFSQ
jgi:hypothetical protein